MLFADDIWLKDFFNLIKILLKFVSSDATDNMSALDQVVAWWSTSNKSLPEAVMPEVTDAHLCQRASICWYKGFYALEYQEFPYITAMLWLQWEFP